MKRVVISGMGLVSPLGNNKAETLESLRETRSGIKFQEAYKEMGLRSHVAGSIDIDIDGLIDRKLRRFMGDAAAFSYIALVEAIMDAGLEESEVSNVRTGIVAGSGGASSSNLIEASDILRSKGIKRVGPYRVTRTMSSTVSACLATAFKIKGVNYSITSACSTSAHCIGHAMELIQLGKQDIVLAGGGEEEHWSMTSLFDAMGALSTQRNDAPAVFLWSKNSNTRRLEARKFMRNWSVMAQLPMVLIWSHRLERAVGAPSRWHWQLLMDPWITLMHMVPARLLAISPKLMLFAASSVQIYHRYPLPNRCLAIH